MFEAVAVMKSHSCQNPKLTNISVLFFHRLIEESKSLLNCSSVILWVKLGRPKAPKTPDTPWWKTNITNIWHRFAQNVGSCLNLLPSLLIITSRRAESSEWSSSCGAAWMRLLMKPMQLGNKIFRNPTV
jgi:hypothetical protein